MRSLLVWSVVILAAVAVGCTGRFLIDGSFDTNAIPYLKPIEGQEPLVREPKNGPRDLH